MSCAFSADGKYILAGTQESTLHLFTTSSYEEVHVLHGHRLGVRACVFSNDSETILSGGLDTAVMLWRIHKFAGKRKHVHSADSIFQGHTQGVRAVACNPRNPDQFASGGDDNCILIWSILKSEILVRFSGHEGSIYSIAYTPSGLFIVTGSHDSTVRVWSQATNSAICTFHGHSGPVFAVLASPDEYSAISAGADSTIRTWDLRGLLRSSTQVIGVRNHLGTVSEEAVENAPKLKKTATSRQHGCINALSFSPDGEFLLSVSSDDTYTITKTGSGQLTHEPVRGHVAPVTCCDFHPEGQYILTGSEDTFSKLWEVGSNILVSNFHGHTSSVSGASFFSSGTHFVSCSLDSTIRIWDVKYARELYVINSNLGHKNSMGQSEKVRCCASSPNNHVFATGGDDNVVRMWDDRCKTSLRKYIGHRKSITACKFSSDGSTFLSASLDKTACLWDMRGSLVHRFEDHSSPVSSVCFSSSGRHLITASWDKCAIVYSSSYLAEVGRWYCSAACHSVAATSQYSVSCREWTLNL